MKLTSTEIKELMIDSKGLDLEVKFIKKDSTTRTMKCRTGVTEFLRGGTNTVKNIPKYVTVYDTEKKAYRNINTETLITLKVANKLYELTNA